MAAVPVTNLDGTACRFYSDDDEEFYDCSSRRSSSADRSQDGKARIQGDTDWIE